jgi:hypothetical protein
MALRTSSFDRNMIPPFGMSIINEGRGSYYDSIICFSFTQKCRCNSNGAIIKMKSLLQTCDFLGSILSLFCFSFIVSFLS